MDYSFSYSFLLLGAVIAGSVMVGILATLPYRLFGAAFENARRADGSLSRKRRRKERKATANFVAELLVAPLVASAVLVGALMLVHNFLIPIPLAADIAAMFSPDPEVFEQRTETGDLGDVGLVYQDWSQQQGFSQSRNLTAKSFLRRNWPVLLILIAGVGGFVYWFVTRYYAQAVQRYQVGYIRRQNQYTQRDASRVNAAAKALRS